MAFQIDSAHSEIEFSARHMMISKVRGSFEKFEGTVDLDEQHPENTRVEVRIETASLDTREDTRDAHLRSPDFFNAEQYPHLIFTSKRVEVLGKNRARLIGDLTIRNVTREVPLDVEFNGLAKSPWGTTSYGFSARGKINRTEWGLTWNKALETGGVLVGDDIQIDIQLELVKQEEEAEKLAQKEAESMEN